MRAGTYVNQATGYKAFIPSPLPPKPAVRMDRELDRLLSDADRSLGRLDGVASILPDSNLFVSMYVRHEAVLSSQIEGTQSTLEDLLSFEAHQRPSTKPSDVKEVRNYIRAMNHGLHSLDRIPLSMRLIREMHAELMRDVRGNERAPGEVRTSQNWIGPAGSTIETAEFVPPPVHELQGLLTNLEQFIHDQKTYPHLINCGIVHAQFETIHPFLDGNGRMGRLLITLQLCERTILREPLLYLSYYFKAFRAQYYDRLMAVRNDGDWEGWLKFFLRGIFVVSQSAVGVAQSILELRERDRRKISELFPGVRNGQTLLDHLYKHPAIEARTAADVLNCSFATANGLIRRMEEAGILVEVTGQARNRLFLGFLLWGLSKNCGRWICDRQTDCCLLIELCSGLDSRRCNRGDTHGSLYRRPA
jgi:Fic family protein